MGLINSNRVFPLLALIVFIGIAVQPLRPQGRPPQVSKSPSATLLRGQQIFRSSCAGCHGLDGRGGERAPSIVSNREMQRLSDAQLFRILQTGIPGTGMPAFASLGNSGITSVGAFLRSLQGNRALARLPGDPQIGKELFFGKASCSECHMVNGGGGFIGADLSSFAANRSVEEVRDAITNPSKNMEARDKAVVVTTQDGKQYVGIARNEDNFSLQLQTLDGAFHFYTKAELQNVKRLSASLMPSDYSSRLTRRELDHVVSYLLATARASKPDKGSETPVKHADND